LLHPPELFLLIPVVLGLVPIPGSSRMTPSTYSVSLALNLYRIIFRPAHLVEQHGEGPPSPVPPFPVLFPADSGSNPQRRLCIDFPFKKSSSFLRVFLPCLDWYRYFQNDPEYIFFKSRTELLLYLDPPSSRAAW
jgi:hypothetical protein